MNETIMRYNRDEILKYEVFSKWGNNFFNLKYLKFQKQILFNPKKVYFKV
jgi:hypothetical protein